MKCQHNLDYADSLYSPVKKLEYLFRRYASLDEPIKSEIYNRAQEIILESFNDILIQCEWANKLAKIAPNHITYPLGGKLLLQIRTKEAMSVRELASLPLLIPLLPEPVQISIFNEITEKASASHDHFAWAKKIYINLISNIPSTFSSSEKSRVINEILSFLDDPQHFDLEQRLNLKSNLIRCPIPDEYKVNLSNEFLSLAIDLVHSTKVIRMIKDTIRFMPIKFQERACLHLLSLNKPKDGDSIQSALNLLLGTKPNVQIENSNSAEKVQMMDKSVLDDHIARLEQETSDHNRFEFLLGIVPFVSSLAHLNICLNTVEQITQIQWKHSAFLKLSSKLTTDFTERALGIARSFTGNDLMRISALSALFPILSNESRVLIFNGIFAEAMRMEPDQRVLALEFIWDFQANSEQIEDSLYTVIYNVKNPERLLGKLCQYIASSQLRTQEFLRWFTKHLYDLSNQTRSDYLQCTIKNYNVFFAPPFLSEEELSAIAQSIIDICTKWEWL